MIYSHSPSRSLSFFAMLVLLSGCSVETENLEVTEDFLLDPRPVDVLWVVDNSGTMAEHQAAVGAAFPLLTSELSALSVDWQMGITATDMSDPDYRGRLVDVGAGAVVLNSTSPNVETLFEGLVQLGDVGSPVERGLEASWAAISHPLINHDNDGFLRDEARLAVVYLSDDEDCSHEGGLLTESSEACAADPDSLIGVNDYLVRYEGLKQSPLDVSLHALVETGATAEFEGCGGSNPGVRIMRAARGTGGMVASLCGELDGTFTELGKQLTGRRTAFPLRRRPDITTLVVQLQPAQGSSAGPSAVVRDVTMQNGWTWHESSNSIRLWGSAVPEIGTTVRVRYAVGIGG